MENQNIELPPELTKKLINLVSNVLSNDNSGRLSVYDSINEETYIESIEENIDQILREFRVEVKNKLVKKFDEAVSMVKKKLNPDSSKYDDIIKLQCRYNRVNSIFIEGRLDYPSADLEFTKIENTFIYLINNVELEDLKKDGGEQNAKRQ